MKLGVADLEQLPWAIRTALEDLEVAIQAGWGVQHAGDGSHNAITGTSSDLTGASDVGGRFGTGGARTFTRNAILSPAQITADQNDYDPVGLADCEILRISSDAARSITGLVTDNTNRSRRILLMNVGSFVITLPHNSGSSTAGYRFGCPASVDFPLLDGAVVPIQYDPNAEVWRLAVYGTMIKSIQRGTISITGANTSATDTITSVDTNKAVPVLLGWSRDAAFTAGVRITLTNATTVTATRGNNPTDLSSDAITVSYQVTEYY